MAKRDPERTGKLRIGIRYLLAKGELPSAEEANRQEVGWGHQSRLAEHFNVSRQRVSQIVAEERRRGDVQTPA